jgi:glucose-1-phosphate cytidylyltransferase
MKLVVLAGGRGARLGDLSAGRPKPLLPVARRPILHRVLDHAASHGFRDVVVALGYRSEDVRAYFDEAPDVEHVSTDRPAALPPSSGDQIRVQTVDTGADASKVGRLCAVEPHVGSETFVLTYCDALSNIDLAAMTRFHRAHGEMLTLAAVHGRERFGLLELDGDRVGGLKEKPVDYDRWINGGTFVLEPGIFAELTDPREDWETGPVQRLIAREQAVAYRHDGWWECVDRPEDLSLVEHALNAEARREQRVAAS